MTAVSKIELAKYFDDEVADLDMVLLGRHGIWSAAECLLREKKLRARGRHWLLEKLFDSKDQDLLTISTHPLAASRHSYCCRHAAQKLLSDTQGLDFGRLLTLASTRTAEKWKWMVPLLLQDARMPSDAPRQLLAGPSSVPWLCVKPMMETKRFVDAGLPRVLLEKALRNSDLSEFLRHVCGCDEWRRLASAIQFLGDKRRKEPVQAAAARCICRHPRVDSALLSAILQYLLFSGSNVNKRKWKHDNNNWLAIKLVLADDRLDYAAHVFGSVEPLLTGMAHRIADNRLASITEAACKVIQSLQHRRQRSMRGPVNARYRKRSSRCVLATIAEPLTLARARIAACRATHTKGADVSFLKYALRLLRGVDPELSRVDLRAAVSDRQLSCCFLRKTASGIARFVECQACSQDMSKFVACTPVVHKRARKRKRS